MKNLRFRSLSLHSAWEKSGRKILFHPKATIIKGSNEVGKSSLLRSLYRCFGAEPVQKNDEWSHAEICSVLTIEVDREVYQLLHASDGYGVFDAHGQSLRFFTKGDADIGPYWAEKLGYGIDFRGRETGDVDSFVLPGCLLSPFYMDQDTSWKKSWSSFKDLGRFRRSISELLELLLRVRTIGYYEHQEQMLELSRRRQEFKTLEGGLSAVAHDLVSHYGGALFDIDLKPFKADIAELASKCAVLSEKDQVFKRRFVELSSKKTELEIQLGIASGAIKELRKDYVYATEDDAMQGDTVTCPMCGASYENTFRERFAIADDEDACAALHSRLRSELIEVKRDIEKLASLHQRNGQEYEAFNELLERRRGEHALGEFIARGGKLELKAILEKKLVACARSMAQVEERMAECKDLMDRSEIRGVRSRVLERFESIMSENFRCLNVGAVSEGSYHGLYFNPDASGSTRPRALLAYQYAVMGLIDEFSRVICPVVIDSPQQQEQERDNLLRMLSFIRDRRPDGAQLILGLVDDCGVDFGGSVIELDAKHHLLRRDQYAEVRAEVRPLLRQMPGQQTLW